MNTSRLENSRLVGIGPPSTTQTGDEASLQGGRGGVGPSKTPLHILPERTADAAENMAVDFLLLRRYPDATAIRFRHYGWRRPAFTFGYSQKIGFVRNQLPPGETLNLTRRATGGGIVDHRDDWTYSMVVPRNHPLFARPGPTLYHAVHGALAESLNDIGADVRLQDRPPKTPAGICFERPELDDIIRCDDSIKVAGAALKRAKYGLLLQGSVLRPALAELGDWETLGDRFASALAEALGAEPTEPGWPDFDPDEEEALIDQYASPAWIEAR